MAKITSFTPTRGQAPRVAVARSRYFLADPNVNEDNRVSIRNEKDGLTRYPSPYEPAALTTGDATNTANGVDLEDVVILDDGTSATIIADDGPNTEVVVIAILSGDPPTLAETDPLTSVDQFYDDQGNSVFVLTDGDDVIGVRG